MKTLVQRWGNSLALRIPKAFAEEISVHEGDEIDMKVTKGRIVIGPPSRRQYRLADLLAGIRPENLHPEVNVGEPRGREVW